MQSGNEIDVKSSLANFIVEELVKRGFKQFNQVEFDWRHGKDINLECVLPNGDKNKILNDGKRYLYAVSGKDDVMWSVASDELQIVVRAQVDHKDLAVVGWFRT